MYGTWHTELTPHKHTPLRVGAFTGLKLTCLYGTRHVGNKQAVVSHLSLPDASQAIVHSLGTPQEVEDPQIQDHTFWRKNL